MSFNSSFTYSSTLGFIHDLEILARGIAEVVKNLARVLWGKLKTIFKQLTLSLNLRLFHRKRWSHKHIILMMVIEKVNPGDLVQIKVKHEIWQVQNTRHRSQPVTSAGHCSVHKQLK